MHIQRVLCLNIIKLVKNPQGAVADLSWGTLSFPSTGATTDLPCTMVRGATDGTVIVAFWHRE